MKFKFDKKYLLRGITALLVVIGGILFWYFIFHGERFISNMGSLYAILVPIFDGMILAYIMTPILNFIEKKWIMPLFTKVFKRKPEKCQKLVRGISILLTALLFVFLIYGMIHMIMSQLIPSIISIFDNFDTYTDNAYKWANKIFDNNPEVAKFVQENLASYSTKIEEWFTGTILPQASELIKSVSLSVISFIKVLWNFILGFIIAIYLLGTKETLAAQSKKILYAFFKKSTANKCLAELRFVNKTFISFFIGKIIDSAIIGILCFIGTSIMGTPYAALVSVIIGVTNIIPFFGPIIGLVPTALLVLIVDFSNPMNALYFIIFVLILQQLDGNVIGPLILGESTGLSSFWIIFAITVFGGFWGVFGMFVGVPLLAVIYSGISRLVAKRLKERDLPPNTEAYLNVGEIDSNNNIVPHINAAGEVISGEIEEPIRKQAKKKKKESKAISTIIHRTEHLAKAVEEKARERLDKSDATDRIPVEEVQKYLDEMKAMNDADVEASKAEAEVKENADEQRADVLQVSDES